MGSTHFLIRRLKNVRREMALDVLACNIKRMVALLGVRRLMRAMQGGSCRHDPRPLVQTASEAPQAGRAAVWHGEESDHRKGPVPPVPRNRPSSFLTGSADSDREDEKGGKRTLARDEATSAFQLNSELQFSPLL
jgi:hypothetical protein